VVRVPHRDEWHGYLAEAVEVAVRIVACQEAHAVPIEQ
jgi:hypothetical protein